ncbi:MAG: hypothetical protein WAQ08_10000 [Aquabacterium sp.]|jgi:hypothetical protein
MRKLLQNTLFAAMTAWALYGVQAHLADIPSPSHPYGAQGTLTALAH